MSMTLQHFCLIVLLAIPAAVLSSVCCIWGGVDEGCGWPSFLRQAWRMQAFFSIVKEGYEFEFGCAGENFFQNLAEYFDGTVGCWIGICWTRRFGRGECVDRSDSGSQWHGIGH